MSEISRLRLAALVVSMLLAACDRDRVLPPVASITISVPRPSTSPVRMKASSVSSGEYSHGMLADVVLTGIPCDWSPDGSSTLAASDGALRFVTLDGESSPLVGDGIDGYAMGGLWSLDGSRVLFSMSLEGQQFDVYTAAADGSDLTQIAGTGLLEESANWLP